jgi:hypothetical protein
MAATAEPYLSAINAVTESDLNDQSSALSVWPWNLFEHSRSISCCDCYKTRSKMVKNRRPCTRTAGFRPCLDAGVVHTQLLRSASSLNKITKRSTLGFCLLWESSTQYFGGVSYSVEFAFRLFLPVLLLSRKGIL